ncbi:PREDICTED: uncharacterized protein LOC104822177 [Tarenaya hassleriana]|uniref:uncharacterized protein LOC104822177 n=1 Tax=Tarenaya hassleriana TaxID=28532 RepID=UPI00053C8E71|nr:PREDICTED: uncharacterized protein LOC104822177 [Tarenaya hassleriana]
MADNDNDNNKRPRDDPSESDLHSPDGKRVKTESIGTPHDPASHDLDSVLKSLEDEVSSCPASNSDESRPELGYLFEASDDELGLPPPPPGATCAAQKNVDDEYLTELVRVSSDSSGIGEFWEFDDVIPCYDSFDLRVGEGFSVDYVPLDDLFEYSDACLDPSGVLR